MNNLAFIVKIQIHVCLLRSLFQAPRWWWKVVRARLIFALLVLIRSHFTI